MSKSGSRVFALAALMAVFVGACGGGNTSSTNGGPQNGGTLVVSWKDDFKTFDPAIGYDVDSWIAERAIFNGLLDYAPNSTKLVPDIAAAMPTISADGKKYTFKLRTGVKFSNGREVVAQDFKYSWERMLDPATSGPMTGGPFWGSITGANDFFNKKATSISGIKVIDTHTLEVDLDSANLSFLNVVAMPFGFVVPKEAVDAAGKDWPRKPVGTGPFKVDKYTAGQLLVLKRNDQFYNRRPYLDEIDFQIGVAPDVGYLRLNSGQVDLPNPDITIPSAQYIQLSNDPSTKTRIISQPNVDIWYLGMNVNMKPFTNPLVRKAFSMIVNKENLVKLLNGRAQPNNGIQAPPMPGFVPSYNPLNLDSNGQDLATAKSLLAQAGYDSKHPFPTLDLVFANASEDAVRLNTSIQQDFQAAGIKLNLKGLAFSAFLDVTGKPNTTALSFDGWIQDFPDPSDFIDPVLTCSTAQVKANGSNVSFYCNKNLDKLADQARGDTNVPERLQLYQQIQDIVASQDHPWAPLYSTVETNIAATRVHGYNIHPVWILTFNDIWVTGNAPQLQPATTPTSS
ncbi:MAG: ABC transporter substrate-binding protein [Candidatus Dormibacteria bacterium]